MLRRRAALAGLVALLAVLAPAAAATAATYPPSTNAIVIGGGSTSITAGDSVDIKASTFESGSDVTFVVSSPLGASRAFRGTSLVAAAAGCSTGSSCVVAADADGVATATVTFTQSGKQTVTATGTGVDGKELVVTSTVTVGAAAATGNEAPTGGLAKTGTDLVKYGVIGVGLVAVGALILVSVRRRSSRVNA